MNLFDHIYNNIYNKFACHSCYLLYNKVIQT